ncbi:MAG: amino acid ABC transporter substrate-binding protein [Eubacteriaceae bacterium]|jgi:polar amino acid transport system substrate-binding protein|nr:amino acid ABC transporter substrate-binding protein [Eubacteriaceae bacterium]
MKRKSVLISLLLVLVLLVSVGCGGAGGDDNKATEEDPLAGGKLKIGTNDTYVPLEFRDENNEMVGFDIDLGDALAKELGVESEWISTAWDGIFNGLNSRQYDIILSGTSITEERLENFNMTEPYIANGIVIVSKTDAEQAQAAKDLEGKKVGVQLETTADYAAESMKKSEDIEFEIKKFDAMLDAFAALEGGSIEYILTDKPVAAFYTAKKPEVYQISSEELSNEPIGATMRKGDVEFAKKVQEAMDKLVENGTMKELSMKWFGEDVTQNISKELKTLD